MSTYLAGRSVLPRELGKTMWASPATCWRRSYNASPTHEPTECQHLIPLGDRQLSHANRNEWDGCPLRAHGDGSSVELAESCRNLATVSPFRDPDQAPRAFRSADGETCLHQDDHVLLDQLIHEGELQDAFRVVAAEGGR